AHVVKVCAPYRDVELSRSQGIGRNAELSLRGVVEIVAAGRTVVARRDRNTDALCRSFLPKVRDESVSVRVGAEFTCSEAQAHNIIGIVIDHIFGAQEEWMASESAFTQNVIDLRVGSDHTRCLDVERSLAFFAIESRIFAVDDDVQVFRREPKKRAIRVDVR